jgi:hypothetical protein
MLALQKRMLMSTIVLVAARTGEEKGRKERGEGTESKYLSCNYLFWIPT